MGKYILTRSSDDSFVNEITSAEEGWQRLLEAILIQAYRDYKNDDQQAKDFLESCELGRKVLAEEKRIYGERE